MKVFFGHAGKIKPIVQQIRNRFPKSIDVWIDEDDLLAGEKLTEALCKAIDDADFVVIFINDEEEMSEWVRKELKIALEKEKESGKI
ncbi:MAG: toll/interleukin-1 receptor domain-containing protein, partial [Pseudomonadota bacterium]